ncbi:hypothetical protein OHA27_24220 [Streptomyces sp. NBC_01619]|uniref:hypothetical protein n=1 Tax=Streptomyces sp. NBC_01619 TaxID=2975901 RepID=UPI00225BA2B3|nr:hypothetical protein [Streptomyces sp. NBC_01619]MCX4513369.1 hypothetical protein [Streptomyces sp. NBC_01619]
MSLDIYVRGLRHDQIDVFGGSPDDSFRRMCDRAPDTGLRSGVLAHGHTMFNSFQLYRFVEELESLPEEGMTPAIQRVLDAAKPAIRTSGYLYFVGD